MNRKLKMLAALCALPCISSIALSQTMPDGKGKAEIERSCLDCHGPDIVLVRKTPEEWRKTVIDMAGRGGNSTPEEINDMVAYLSRYFGANKPTTQISPSSDKSHTPGLTRVQLARYFTVLSPVR